MLSTIGYENADLDDFIATLETSGVKVLVDIRDRAQSRRKGFSKSALSEALKASDIEYFHFRELGDPKEGREAARSGKLELFKRIFLEVMETDRARVALKEIAKIAKKKRICLMCYERNQRECHRKIVSDHLENVLNCKTDHLGVKKGIAKYEVAADVTP